MKAELVWPIKWIKAPPGKTESATRLSYFQLLSTSIFLLVINCNINSKAYAADNSHDAEDNHSEQSSFKPANGFLSLISDTADSQIDRDTHSRLPHIAQWVCEFCPSAIINRARVTANLSHLSDFDLSNDNFRFSHFSGVKDSTALYFDADFLKINQTGGYFQSTLKNAGLDSLMFNSDYGVYGQYRLSMDVVNVPTRQYQGLITPFNNVGNHQLALPENWIFFAGLNRPAISENWSQFDLQKNWQRMKLDWQHQLNQQYDYQLNYQHIESSGIREFSSAQIWNISYLPLVTDQQTDQLDAILSYQGDGWQGAINYQFSAFKNNLNRFSYSNPFVSFNTDNQLLQQSVEPDNNALKVGVNLNFDLNEKSWIKLQSSVSRLTQDQPFLPYSVDPVFSHELPSSDLNGQVEVSDLSLRWYNKLSADLTLRAKYRYRDQDNQTEQLRYQPIVSDSYLGAEMTNLAYDYQSEKYSFASDWRFYPGQLLSIELQRDFRERNFSAIKKNDNLGLETKLRLNHQKGLQFNLTGSRFERGASSVELIDLLSTTENPLMQRYNQAERIEDKLGVELSLATSEYYAAGVFVEATDIDYPNSIIGLQQSQRKSHGVDLNWHFSLGHQLSTYWQNESAKIDQVGSQNFSAPDWHSYNQDNIDSFGVTWEWKKLLDNNFRFLIEFNQSLGKTQTFVDDRYSASNQINTNQRALPAINSDWQTTKIRLDYAYSKQWHFQLSYRQERFDSDDFTIDGINPGDVNNLITFSANSFNYDVNYIVISASYNWQ